MDVSGALSMTPRTAAAIDFAVGGSHHPRRLPLPPYPVAAPARQLGAYAGGHATDADLQRWLDAVLAADALGVERSDSTPWDDAPDDARLFWRLVYLFEGTGGNGAPASGASP